MKDMEKKAFHIVPRAEIPDLSQEGSYFRIQKRSEEKSRVETWTVQPSIETQDQEENIQYKKKKRKPLSDRTKRTIRRWVIAGVLTAAVAVSYLSITLQTYTGIEVIDQIQKAESGNSFYIRYEEEIMSCDADGVSLFDLDGKEIWTESIQFQKPVMEVSGSSAAIAEQGGNVIAVFGETGMRGQIKTTLPIEKMTVSDQGITAVILENGRTPVIQCYDVSGNVLVEYRIASSTSGYPVDLALSPDGTMLLVSYLVMNNGQADTKIIYYDFGNKHEDGNYQIGNGTYKNQLMPTVFFVSNDKSVAVGDKGFVIYKGSEPEEEKKIEIKKEIRSIAYDGEYLALVLANGDSSGYELRLYDYDGKEIVSKKFEGDFGNVKIDQGQVILFDNENASIFTEGGIHRFEGTMGAKIKDIFVLKGINKYLLMSNKGTQTVRLIK